jgi:tRNA(adenine34) deaminase
MRVPSFGRSRRTAAAPLPGVSGISGIPLVRGVHGRADAEAAAADERFMRAALDEAKAALEHGDVPIGAVAVHDGQIVARAHNERERKLDPTAHAEVLLLKRTARALGRRHLDDVDVYVTIEPCPMCAGALVLARIRRLVYGAPDEKAGAAYSLYNIVQDPRLNHECRITRGVLAQESAEVLQAFFRGRRSKAERP